MNPTEMGVFLPFRFLLLFRKKCAPFRLRVYKYALLTPIRSLSLFCGYAPTARFVISQEFKLDKPHKKGDPKGCPAYPVEEKERRNGRYETPPRSTGKWRVTKKNRLTKGFVKRFFFCILPEKSVLTDF